MMRYVKAGKKQLRNALNQLSEDGMIAIDGEILSLTEKGMAEALRLKKAHRVWETYLHYMGVPEEKLHEKAHVLEHYHDDEAIQHIYEKMGSPATDPHGAKIPEIYSDGSFCLTSMFGFSGSDVEVVYIKTDKGIKTGDLIRVKQNDDGFEVVCNQQVIELNNKEVESLIVKIPENF